jgi:iron complex outermembrane receptor protein
MPFFEGTNWPLSFRWVTKGDPGTDPVLFLHGLGSSGADWFPQWTVLENEWSILTVDLPGHGQSPPLKQAASMSDLAGAVEALLRDQGVNRAHLVGLSLGALVGLQLALAYPQRLRSLILVNGFGRYRPGNGGLLSAIGRLVLLLLGRMDWVGAWVARSVFPGQDQIQFRQQAAARIASVDRTTYWYYLRALASFDVVESLEAIKVPSMVVAGADDQIVGLQAKLELARRMPEARLEIFPGSGHATPIDAMTAFNKAIVSWLHNHG